FLFREIGAGEGVPTAPALHGSIDGALRAEAKETGTSSFLAVRTGIQESNLASTTVVARLSAPDRNPACAGSRVPPGRESGDRRRGKAGDHADFAPCV